MPVRVCRLVRGGFPPELSEAEGEERSDVSMSTSSPDSADVLYEVSIEGVYEGVLVRGI